MSPLWIKPVVLTAIAACAPKPDYRPNFVEPTQIVVQGDGPTDAPEGSCWGKDESPATIETVIQTELETPEQRAQDGTVLQAATYRSVQSQRIVAARGALWFETPCPNQVDAAFVTALQRALALRGYFKAEPDGVVDAATVAAIRAYQRTLDLNSGQLSLTAARKLGLVAYSRADIAEF